MPKPNYISNYRRLKASGVRTIYTPEQAMTLEAIPSPGRLFARTMTGEQPGGIYRQVEWQLNQKMGDIKRALAAEIQSAVSEMPKRARVQSSTPSVSRQPNRSVRARLSGEYSGESPHSRVKGKGRSTSFEDIYKPSLELQPGDPASRRIGSLTGSSSGGRGGSRSQSGATMLSRFGANKDFGPGLSGASASRLRGAKNLMAHPETWMKRYAAYWILSETARAYTDWQGWNKVSFGMSTREAEKAMGPEPSLSGLPLQAAGNLVSIGAGVARPAVNAGIALGGALMGRSRAQQAQASALFESVQTWAASGFQGPSPWAALDKTASDAVTEYSYLQGKAAIAAEKGFRQNLRNSLVRMKDNLALRGVGGIFDMVSAVQRTPEAQAALEAVKRAAKNSVDAQQVYENVMNRNLKHVRD